MSKAREGRSERAVHTFDDSEVASEVPPLLLHSQTRAEVRGEWYQGAMRYTHGMFTLQGATGELRKGSVLRMRGPFPW